MKEKIKMYKMEKGMWDPDKEFEINESDDLKWIARRKFEDMIMDRKPVDKKELLIQTFEGLLYEKRRLERE